MNIYPINGNLYDARKTAQLHIAKEHHSMLHYMLGMNTNFLGITEVQKQFIEMLATGISDKEITATDCVRRKNVRSLSLVTLVPSLKKVISTVRPKSTAHWNVSMTITLRCAVPLLNMVLWTA